MRTSRPQSEHLTVGKTCDILSVAMMVNGYAVVRDKEGREKGGKKANTKKEKGREESKWPWDASIYTKSKLRYTRSLHDFKRRVLLYLPFSLSFLYPNDPTASVQSHHPRRRSLQSHSF